MNHWALINISYYYCFILTSRCCFFIYWAIYRIYIISMFRQCMSYFSWIYVINNYLIVIISCNYFASIWSKTYWIYCLSRTIDFSNKFTIGTIPKFYFISSCWNHLGSISWIFYSSYPFCMIQKFIFYTCSGFNA